MTLALAALPNDVDSLQRLIVDREQVFTEERREREQLIAAERRERESLVAQLNQRLAAAAAAQLAELREEAERQLQAERARHAAELQAAIAALLRRYYGPRSESFDPRQLLLFGQTVEQAPLDEASIAAEAGEPLVTRRAGKRHAHGRAPLPE